MRVFRGLPPAADQPVALTIGTFDGIHRGHQAMLSRLIEAASDLALAPAVLTFDPYPREFFARDSAPPRLTSLRTRINRFAAHGVEHVYIARFNRALAGLAPQEFVDDVLVRRLGVRWVLVGEDFRFGRARAGDIDTLRQSARTFSVETMQTVEIAGGRASSTAVRQALGAGDIETASELLGHAYTMTGRVAHGKKLGRSLGFPTANIPLRYRPAITGIFAVRVHGLGGAALPAVASIGVRPTVDAGSQPLLEVFILDFNEQIYGRRITVEFLHKFRDEERYANLDLLVAQIRADVAQAREYFSAPR